ncbi:hypothetical protein HDU93_009495 [Gonapodya sp. JEL0774]|nr:hypothetical protein HDU93_009495 [Gonapodya sp. JEL0774]
MSVESIASVTPDYFTAFTSSPHLSNHLHMGPEIIIKLRTENEHTATSGLIGRYWAYWNDVDDIHDDGLRQDAIDPGGKLHTVVLASSFGRDMARHFLPPPDATDADMNTHLTIQLTRFCMLSRTLRTILIEPSLNPLPRVLEAATDSLSAKRSSPPESSSTLAQQTRVSGAVRGITNSVLHKLTPQMDKEAASRYAKLVKKTGGFHSILPKILLQGGWWSFDADRKIEFMALVYTESEKALEENSA